MDTDQVMKCTHPGQVEALITFLSILKSLKYKNKQIKQLHNRVMIQRGEIGSFTNFPPN